VVQMVEAVCYKPEVMSLSYDWVIEIFDWLNPSGHTVAPGVCSSSNKNEYLGVLWGIKAASAWG